MAVIEPTDDGLVLRERAPGVTVEAILAATGAPLRVEGPVPEMRLGAAMSSTCPADARCIRDARAGLPRPTCRSGRPDMRSMRMSATVSHGAADGRGARGRRNTATLVERSVVLLLLGLLLLGVALVLRPFATALLFALIIAVATWPIRSAACAVRGLSPGLAATLMSLAGLLAVGLPVLAIAPRLATRLAEGARGLEAALAALPSVPPDWVTRMPLAGGR